jgi:signal transduction histidine kinase
LSDCEGKAEDLLALIDDLLEVWRLEEASLTLDLQKIAPGALFAELVHDWALRFKQEGAVAAVDVSDDAPVFEADKTLLMRVLGNLVQNAMTHTASSVQLILAAKKDGDGVQLTVSDNGPGIPPEYHELIFRKFERVRNPNIPRTRSSGLGLAFCKLVADAHGGRIWVRSPGEGQGSSFHIYLPLKPPSREVKVSAGSIVIQ